MRPDLKQRLITWKNDLHAGETKKVFVSDSPLNDGEYIIKLEKTLSGTLAGKLNGVAVSNKFLTVTQHQALNDSTSDMDHLSTIINSLEKEFNDRYEQVVNDTFENKLKRYAELN